MTVCDKCQGRAIIYQRYSGMHLCQAHFDQDVHRKVRESLRHSSLFGRGARVAVGLGGGRSSATLLYILKNLFSRRRDIDLLAIIIDEGQEGRAALEEARALAGRLAVPCVVKSLSPASGANLPDLALAKKAFSCGSSFALKKDLLERAAREMEASVLATGHSLDDEALDIFISYLQGDVDGLFRLGLGEGQVPWIKPLRRIPEREIRLYAIAHGLGSLDSHSQVEPLRAEAKRLLDGFDLRHPGTKYSLLRSLERVLALKEAGCHSSPPRGQSL
ncbi:tRNA 2-thiocytidine biosynthesis protein TtcA [uncultured archaeon]|nr:tRNA 2-thiocytidine biosynthesis protein TtcA [uncultured archaeon]